MTCNARSCFASDAISSATVSHYGTQAHLSESVGVDGRFCVSAAFGGVSEHIIANALIDPEFDTGKLA
jgi:hypothetical protein